jgi:hypothetical protein
MKHTSGKWEAYGPDTCGAGRVFVEYKPGHMMNICEPGYAIKSQEALANARLIAAAPELLEACKTVLTDWHNKPSNFYKKEPTHLEKIRAAIAKTEGR